MSRIYAQTCISRISSDFINVAYVGYPTHILLCSIRAPPLILFVVGIVDGQKAINIYSQ